MTLEKIPDREDYRNEASYESALRKYRVRRRARFVWPQISLEERVWILEKVGASNPGTRAALDFDELRLNLKQTKAISDYPRSEHRRDIYKAKLVASPPRKVRVRKHEKRLREKYGPTFEQYLEERGV